MNKDQTLANRSRKAALLSIIPGAGQIANRQFSKGILFLVITGLFICELAIFGYQALIGLVTLGTVPGRPLAVSLDRGHAAIDFDARFLDVLHL